MPKITYTAMFTGRDELVTRKSERDYAAAWRVSFTYGSAAFGGGHEGETGEAIGFSRTVALAEKAAASALRAYSHAPNYYVNPTAEVVAVVAH